MFYREIGMTEVNIKLSLLFLANLKLFKCAYISTVEHQTNLTV